MKKMFKVLSMVLALVLALTCAAFAEAPSTDRAGNAIVLPTEINKIISLAPSTSQILESLGMLDKVIAVDTYTPGYIESTAELPQFDMMTPDVEQIAALEPDVVFTTGMSYIDGNPYAALTNMGVCVIEIPTSSSIVAVEEDVLFVAQCVGKLEEGQVLVDEMQGTIDAIAEIGATIEDKKSVFFEIGALPYLYSFGTGTFLNEMIDLIGATNVLGEQEGWVSVTEEDAVAANPDVILTSVNYIEDAVGEIKGREGWQNVTAVANVDVYYIDNGTSSLANHHIVDALIEMALAVYPEQYAQFAE